MPSKRTLSFVLLLTSTAATTAFAADQSAVIVTVGNATMTEEAVSRRIAALPPYQLARYGKTASEQKKNFVEQVLVPEMLYGEEAKQRKLDETPGMQDRLREALRDALDRNLREEALAKDPVTDADIKQYYDENKARFETPKRLRLWRIQVADEATAKDIIAQSKGTDGPKHWADLARDKSLDKATAQRGGELGFVRQDGSTDVPRISVDPAVFAAADKVTDGALVPQPIKEGDRFSVIWRRGSVEASKRTVEEESTSIRQILERRRVDKARQDLISQLRKDHVTEEHPELLSNIDPQMFGSPPRRDFGRDGGVRRMHHEGPLGGPLGAPMGGPRTPRPDGEDNR
ncbi:MAG TPA: peptidyl-prolyl cis-trans isomerase [Polyangiaceae bacterium]|nr:peptidyl-prolyl cis-trans isomerase [Polyangiaceae bacterium]